VPAHFCIKTEAIGGAGLQWLCQHVSPHDTENSFGGTLATSGETMSFAVMTELLPRHRITVDEYYRMAEDGRIAPDARTELIEGEVIEMPSVGSLHASTTDRLEHLLRSNLGESVRIRVQHPVHLDNYSEPQPDLAVVLPRKDFYHSHHPTRADTYLIVEVSQSSLRMDLNVKVPLYAQHQVPEVWVVDLEHNRIHFFRSPHNGAYTDVSFTDKPEAVALTALPGIAVDLSELFAS
jgi:Uma2 family endonuclease